MTGEFGSAEIIPAMEESMYLMLPEPLTDRCHRRVVVRKFPTVLIDPPVHQKLNDSVDSTRSAEEDGTNGDGKEEENGTDSS